MEAKSISYLNSKKWYRLLRILYTLIVVGIGLVIIGIQYDKFAPRFDRYNSYVKCDSGKIISLSEAGVHLYSKYIQPFDDQELARQCADSADISNKSNYKLVSIYTSSWFNFILRSFAWLVIIIFIEEVIRRIFYFIFLGSVNPTKKI